ncbi:MAG: stage III sporulation protein AC [Clostridiales bacterium]|nr:stage III sporulation protein AC [Clostridiales bacterium]MDY2835685.1 stage III sporulation protein AC [Candidatus Aphodomonas sp.]
MNVDLLIRIAGVGILVSVLAQILNRTGREDMAMLTTLAGLAIVLLAVVNLISQLFQSVRSIFAL